jgi:hypothetical protein
MKGSSVITTVIVLLVAQFVLFAFIDSMHGGS